MKWPYSSRSSQQDAAITVKAPDHDYAAFKVNDDELPVTLTSDMWGHVCQLAYQADTSAEDAMRALLFEALYGKASFAALSQHAAQTRKREEAVQRQLDACADVEGLRKSRDRLTDIDLQHVGKADTPRRVRLPRRMAVDLKRLAQRAGVDVSTYVRGMLFRTLFGEMPHAEWQKARSLI